MKRFIRVFSASSARLVACEALLLGMAISVGCGPSYNESTIKTAEDRMREQEELAYKDELADRNRADDDNDDFEEEVGGFDEKHANLEFKQATLSAETCPEVAVADKKPLSGNTSVTVTFGRDGLVTAASIPPPFEGTQLGSCVLNAYKRINVPPYRGEIKVITWDLKLKKRPKQ